VGRGFGEGGLVAEDVGECCVAVFAFEGGCAVLPPKKPLAARTSKKKNIIEKRK
jgi:hypothetical protein